MRLATMITSRGLRLHVRGRTGYVDVADATGDPALASLRGLLARGALDAARDLEGRDSDQEGRGELSAGLGLCILGFGEEGEARPDEPPQRASDELQDRQDRDDGQHRQTLGRCLQRRRNTVVRTIKKRRYRIKSEVMTCVIARSLCV